MDGDRSEHLIVDGYNAVHGWVELVVILRQQGLAAARDRLVSALAGYAAVRTVEVTVVFDAHARPRGGEGGQRVDGVTVCFGHSGASADNVIERMCADAARRGDVDAIVVATSDRLQRDMVRSMGAATMSTSTLEAEVARAAQEMAGRVRRLQERADIAIRVEDQLDVAVRQRLERIRRGDWG